MLEVDVGEAETRCGGSTYMWEGGGIERATGDAEAAGRAIATSTSDVKDAQVPRVSDAQRIQLYRQAMVMKDMQDRKCDRDMLQLGHLEDASRAMNDTI